MFNFHNTIFSIIYIIISFTCGCGFYFSILFKIVDKERVFSKNISMFITYFIGSIVSAIFTYYLFEIVRFIQYMY